MDEFLRTFSVFYFKEGEQTIKLYQALGKTQNDHPLALKLLLDSKSIEKRMPKLSRRAISILKYYEVSPLVFRRTAYQSKSSLVRPIPEIRLTDSNERKCVETPEGGKYGLRKFADMDAQYFGKEILNKQGLTKEEIENIQLFYPRCLKSI